MFGKFGKELSLSCRSVSDIPRLFRLALDSLGVKQIISVIGGSMGGMHVLEFAYFGPEYVKSIIPIATSASYSAWGIGWGEMQRQCIYSDTRFRAFCPAYPGYKWAMKLTYIDVIGNGYYDHDEVSDC